MKIRFPFRKKTKSPHEPQVALASFGDVILVASTAGENKGQTNIPSRLSIREAMGLREVSIDGKDVIRTQTIRASGVDYPEDFSDYQDYLEAYRRVPYVSRATDIKQQYIWQVGYDLEGDETKIEALNKSLAQINADIIIREGCLWTMVFGNFYWHIEKRNPLTFKPLDPTRVGISRDGKTYVYTENLGRKREFPAEEILHLKLESEPWQTFGYGTLRRVIITVRQVLYMKKYLPEIARNRADPWLKFTIRDPETKLPYPREQHDRIKAAILGRRPGENLFDDGSVEVQEVYQTASVGGRQTLEGILESFQADLVGGLGVPEVYLAAGSTTLKGTAEHQEVGFEAEVRGIQRTLKRFHEQQLFPLLGVEDVKLVWRPLKPEDKERLSRRFMAEIEHSVITPEYARQMLGYPPAEEMKGQFYSTANLIPTLVAGKKEARSNE